MDLNPRIIENGHETIGRLGATWCLWEKYQSTQYQTKDNYTENLQIIYEFKTLEEFARLWKFTPYSEPSKLFFDVERQMSKKFSLDPEAEDMVAESLLLFRKGVKPEWEDPANKQGSSLQVEFKDTTSTEIDGLWRSIIFSIVGGTFPHSERIMGFRLLDRLKKHQMLKCEIWTSVPFKNSSRNKEENEVNEKMQSEIMRHLHQLCNETMTLSIHSIIPKDHSVANKM